MIVSARGGPVFLPNDLASAVSSTNSRLSLPTSRKFWGSEDDCVWVSFPGEIDTCGSRPNWT